MRSVRSALAGCRAVRDSTLAAWYPPLAHLAREGRMTVTIGRRELLVALGSAAAAWPLAARAQQPAMPVIGSLSSLGQAISVRFDAAFRRGLSDVGYVEGQNVSVEYRWITDRYLHCRQWRLISYNAKWL